MDDDRRRSRPKDDGPAPSAKAVREAKLAQALRDNLRRRKGAPAARPSAPCGPDDPD